MSWIESTDKFPEGVYRLDFVPNRTNIDIHPANYVEQLEGCIALGLEAEMKLAWERLGNHLEQLTRSPEGKINE